MSERILLLIGLMVMTVVLGMVGKGDQEEAEAQSKEYCQMVELWHESGGENGWPPYKGECK